MCSLRQQMTILYCWIANAVDSTTSEPTSGDSKGGKDKRPFSYGNRFSDQYPNIGIYPEHYKSHATAVNLQWKNHRSRNPANGKFVPGDDQSAGEKRLGPALMAIPTFLGQATDRPQCLDWLSRVKNVCDQSGRSFRQELINKSGILVQNFIRSLSDQITNKELTEKILQFFSDIPTTSHALNKLRLIKQELDEPIVNYNQRYQNLVERVEGCQLNSITSMVAMELYLGSIIEPIRKSIRNALYFNSKHAPKTLGEAMQKAQDLHIKHLYASGEDQQEILTTNSQEVMPEITVHEANIRENKGWYRNNREFREHSQDSRETQRQPNSYI